MSGNSAVSDLKTIVKREEIVHFIDQLESISMAQLAVLDNQNVVIYASASVEEPESVQAQWEHDSVSYYTIELGGVKFGSVAAKGKSYIKSDTLENAASMLIDRLIRELQVDDLASEVIDAYQELNLHYDVSKALSSIMDTGTICRTILEQAVSIINPKVAFIMLLDSDMKQLIVQASVCPDGDMKGLRVVVEDSIFEGIIEDKSALIVEDEDKYPHLWDRISRSRMMLDTPLMCVPVIAEDRVLGVIGMSGKIEADRYTSSDTSFLYAIAYQAGMSLGNIRLYEDLQSMFLNTVEALAAAVEVRDVNTHGHCRRVAEYSAAIAEELGLPDRKIHDLRLAGTLHDIGKIGIPDSVLKQRGQLSQDQMEELRSHPVKGAGIIQRIPQMDEIALWIRHHHERYDGRGYPNGLSGEDIPFCSRILAVAEDYDSVVSAHDGQVKCPHYCAMSKLRSEAGLKLDPGIVRVFSGVLRENAYQQYSKAYLKCKHPPMPRLSRLAYYRIENEISSILGREDSGERLTEVEMSRVQELKSMVLHMS